MACRPGPSFRALLFGCGGGAVLGQTATFLVGSESNVRQWGPWPAGPVRPSGPCCFGVAQAPFWVRQLGFLVGSESNVRQWGPWPAGPVRPSGPCCFGVASAPCESLGAVGRQVMAAVALRPGQGPAVWLWRRRRFRSDSYFSCRLGSVPQGLAVSVWRACPV